MTALAQPGVASNREGTTGEVLATLTARLELADATRLARAGRYAEADARLAVARSTPAGLDLRARMAGQQGRFDEAAALWREAAERLGTPNAFAAEIAAVDRRRTSLRGPAGHDRRRAAVVALLALGLGVGGWVGRESSNDRDALERLRADALEALDALDSRVEEVRRDEEDLAERLDQLASGFPTDTERAGASASLRDRLGAIAGVGVRSDDGILRVRLVEPAFTDGVALAPAGRAALAAIAAAVAPDAPRYFVVVTGHTDALPLRPGSRFTDNEELAHARARAASDALVAGGLPAEAIAIGLPEQRSEEPAQAAPAVPAAGGTAPPPDRTVTLTVVERAALSSSPAAARPSRRPAGEQRSDRVPRGA